jgi:putative endonuclease
LQFVDINDNQKRIGSAGEKIARAFLKTNGWRIVAKNVKFGIDELDILAVSPDESILAIIEVRSTSQLDGNPESTLTQRKRKAMCRVARKVNPHALRHNCDLRLDLITVRLAADKPLVHHYKGILRI